MHSKGVLGKPDIVMRQMARSHICKRLLLASARVLPFKDAEN